MDLLTNSFNGLTIAHSSCAQQERLQNVVNWIRTFSQILRFSFQRLPPVLLNSAEIPRQGEKFPRNWIIAREEQLVSGWVRKTVNFHASPTRRRKGRVWEEGFPKSLLHRLTQMERLSALSGDRETDRKANDGIHELGGGALWADIISPWKVLHFTGDSLGSL